jgi:uncharacterized integral membrane protein
VIKPLLILLLGLAVTGATFWTSVHALRKVLHIKDSGLDPAAGAPEAGSPYGVVAARQARAARMVIIGGIVTILALIATW